MDEARPLLTRLRAENVRSFARLDLELGALTVLVGPNGAGKSNVVSALRFMRDAVVRGVDDGLANQRGLSFMRRRGETGMSVCAEVSSVSESVEFSAGVSAEGEEYYRPRLIRGPHTVLEASRGLQVYADFERGAVSLRGMNWMDRMFVCQAEPLDLRDRSQYIASDRSLRDDFSNLGAILLAIQETPFRDKMDRALALLVDGVTGYTVAQAGSTLVPQILYGADDARDLGMESDGTIRLVALLAAMYQPVSPSILVLEEPEMGLHPGVLSALAEFITEASTRMQVLVTTHSPDLIDCFDLDAIRVVEKIDGETRVGLVRPQQREAIRRQLFSTSEIMRMEGLQLDIG